MSLGTAVNNNVITIKHTTTYEYTCISLEQLNLLYDLSIINQCMGMKALHIGHSFAIKYPFQTTQDDTLVFPQITCVIIDYFIKTAVDVTKHFSNLETVVIHFDVVNDENLSDIMLQLINSLICNTLYVMITTSRWSYTSMPYGLIDLIKAVVMNSKIKTLVIHNNQNVYCDIDTSSDITFNRSFHLYLSNMSIKFNSAKNLTTYKFNSAKQLTHKFKL